MQALTAHRTTVSYWHFVHTEPCEHGPARLAEDGALDAACAEHGLLWVHAGHNGWPTDLTELGGLRMHIYADGQWSEVMKVIEWQPLAATSGTTTRLAQYTVILAGTDEPTTIIPEAVTFSGSP